MNDDEPNVGETEDFGGPSGWLEDPPASFIETVVAQIRHDLNRLVLPIHEVVKQPQLAE
jgi:hypothetical protein